MAVGLVRISAAIAACLLPLLLSAQTVSKQVIPLWPNGAPGAQGNAEADRPTLTIFPATGDNKTATGVVVFPGGGYSHLATGHEGVQIAAWLNKLGISAFMLEYRLGPKYHYPVELWDAQRAIRYVRAHAGEYGVRADRIGVWGFSAGGHLASTAGTHFDNGDANGADAIDKQSSRPDFLILAYPVITFEEPYAHLGGPVGRLAEGARIPVAANARVRNRNFRPSQIFYNFITIKCPVGAFTLR